MADFEIAYPKTVSNEGYYVSQDWFRSHGDNHSGETYMGIDRGANPSWEGWPIIDNYKAQNGTPGYNFRFPVSLGLEDLVKKRAKQLYWDAIKGDQIANQSVAEDFFEQIWGGYGGVKSFQKVMNGLTPDKSPLKIDGGVGNDTLSRINSIPPDTLHDALWNDRKSWIQKYGAKVNANAVNGWTARLNRFKDFIGEQVSQQVTQVTQDVTQGVTQGVTMLQKNPIILIAGTVLILGSIFMFYKYKQAGEVATTT